MTIHDLQQLRPLLNLAELARRAAINEQTLFARVRRGTPLRDEEAEALDRALRKVGLHYNREEPGDM